jgi:hypothetical protein
MSSTLDRMREEEAKARILRHLAQRYRERDIADIADMAEAIWHGSKPEPLPDVPLHKRGFGVMAEDVP